jgi:hypothetical protein
MASLAELLCLSITFLPLSLAQESTSPSKYWCEDNGRTFCDSNGTILSDLSCGWCRSWTFASNIAGNKLRLIGLDGGALPGDGNATRDYMVEASLDEPFNLTDGTNWKLSVLPSGYPKLKGGALWSDPSNTTLFEYGGHSVDLFAPNETDIPTFKTRENKWSMTSALITIQRLTTGTSVNVPDLGQAYYIGGYQSNYTSANVPRDGLSHYATSMLQFSTGSIGSVQFEAPFLPAQFGAVAHIPLGDSDVLIYFGGETPNSQVLKSRNVTEFTVNSWEYVWIYDIKRNKWYRQATTGTITPRSEFCTATVSDPATSSWQIWVFGGGDFKTKNVVDTVSVLSIPAFRWFSAGPAAIRMATSCQRYGAQVFVIGGLQSFSPGRGDYPAIAYVYDLNKQQAVSTFVPGLTEYAAPTAVREGIAVESTPATWAEPAVQSLFMSGRNGYLDSSSRRVGNRISRATIAGICVAAVVGILLIALATMRLLRQRKRSPECPVEVAQTVEKPETDLQQTANELVGQVGSLEGEAVTSPHSTAVESPADAVELASEQRLEMGVEQRAELPSKQRFELDSKELKKKS